MRAGWSQAQALGAGPGVAPNADGKWIAGPGTRDIGAPLDYLLIDVPEAPPPPPLPYKVDTSRPSLRTNWTRLVPF